MIIEFYDIIFLGKMLSVKIPCKLGFMIILFLAIIFMINDFLYGTNFLFMIKTKWIYTKCFYEINVWNSYKYVKIWNKSKLAILGFFSILEITYGMLFLILISDFGE